MIPRPYWIPGEVVGTKRRRAPGVRGLGVPRPGDARLGVERRPTQRDPVEDPALVELVHRAAGDLRGDQAEQLEVRVRVVPALAWRAVALLANGVADHVDRA